MPFHRRQHRTDHIEIAEVVDFKFAADVVEGRFFKWSEQREAGVVDENVHADPFSDDFDQDGLNLRGVGDIASKREQARMSLIEIFQRKDEDRDAISWLQEGAGHVNP